MAKQARQKKKYKKVPTSRRQVTASPGNPSSISNQLVRLNGLGYDAAGTGRRSRGWLASALGPNTILSAEGETLLRRSRDLMRQNPWAFSGVESFVAHCVGTGIKPQCRAADEAFREEVQECWPDWVLESDADGFADFYGQQALVARSVAEGGECFVRLRERRPEDDLCVPLQLQVLEGEHVPLTKNEALPNGNVIKAGIEFNGIGRRVAYHMHRTHPGETRVDQRPGSLDLVRVPAENVLHVYRPLRPGQIRGEPWMARVLIRLHELDKYDDALLTKQQIAALLCGFITSPEQDAAGMFGEEDPNAMGAAIAGLQPGILQFLMPGQQVQWSNPPTVSGEEGFLKHQLRGSATGLGVPYSSLSGDMSDANFSSLRAAIIEFRRRCEMFLNQVLVFQLCRPVWRRWITLGVLSGVFSAEAFLEGQRECFRSRWIGQGWQWVDPQKEVNAAVTAIRAGIKSRSQVVTEQGDDPDALDEMIASDNARADELGLVFDSDPRRRDATGKEAAETEQVAERVQALEDASAKATLEMLAAMQQEVAGLRSELASVKAAASIKVPQIALTVEAPKKAPLRRTYKVRRDNGDLQGLEVVDEPAV